VVKDEEGCGELCDLFPFDSGEAGLWQQEDIIKISKDTTRGLQAAKYMLVD
jgi:hypothetical protein